MKNLMLFVSATTKILSVAAVSLLLGCGVGFSTGGSQTASSTHIVELSWVASTSPRVIGYNIYRALYTDSCGSFSKINSALNVSTMYTDSEVAGGAAYCYATTAVNTNNEESGYSNIVSNIQIPSQ